MPVLYGEVTSWDESAITVLFPKVWDKTKDCVMSDYERRYPTHCDDIGSVLKQLLEKRTNVCVSYVFEILPTFFIMFFFNFVVKKKVMYLSTFQRFGYCWSCNIEIIFYVMHLLGDFI